MFLGNALMVSVLGFWSRLASVGMQKVGFGL